MQTVGLSFFFGIDGYASSKRPMVQTKNLIQSIEENNEPSSA